MIRTIIVEDEDSSAQLLLKMLSDHFKDINVSAICKTVEEAKATIARHKPSLVFCDVELEGRSAFEMLQELESIDFDVIFTTAYERYAIQAIKFSALDYLLKPFSLADLVEAVSHYKEKQHKKQSNQQFDAFLHNLKTIQKDLKKISLPTLNGLLVLSIKDIIRCQADVNYTTFFLVNKTKIVVAKTLKEFEDLLNDYDFIRVHNSHLINLHHISNYTKGEGGTVTLSDGMDIDVSRRKKDEFLKRLAQL